MSDAGHDPIPSAELGLCPKSVVDCKLLAVGQARDRAGDAGQFLFPLPSVGEGEGEGESGAELCPKSVL